MNNAKVTIPVKYLERLANLADEAQAELSTLAEKQDSKMLKDMKLNQLIGYAQSAREVLAIRTEIDNKQGSLK